MVENVSKELLGNTDIVKYNLSPCKICNPPNKTNYEPENSYFNKAVGESTSVRCRGFTREGNRCKHKTKLANGYCYQHNQNTTLKYNNYSKSSNNFYSTCGAKTQSGGYCKRKVKGGGRCYQH